MHNRIHPRGNLRTFQTYTLGFRNASQLFSLCTLLIMLGHYAVLLWLVSSCASECCASATTARTARNDDEVTYSEDPPQRLSSVRARPLCLHLYSHIDSASIMKPAKTTKLLLTG